MTKPRITKVKGTQLWDCEGTLGKSPRLAYWRWHKLTGGRLK